MRVKSGKPQLLRTVLKERVARPADETDRVQNWLKTEQSKEFVRQSPDLKEVFSDAGTAAKMLAKEQAAALSTEESALGEIKSNWQLFASNNANPQRIRS
jgi:hypothetical protein